MSMDGFIGEYNHTIDTKGRVIIPLRFREELGEKFYLSKGLDGCLWIHPMEEWQQFRASLRELSAIDEDSRLFKRFFLSGATECELDKQGRILIPGPLRTYAKLIKDVVVTGLDNRIEVWSQENWDIMNDLDPAAMNKVAARLSSMGIKI